MKRKIVTVPLTTLAMDSLCYGQDPETDFVDHELSEAEFESLLTAGVIDDINQQLDVWIDEYEDEQVLGCDKIKLFEQVLAKYNGKKDTPLFRALNIFAHCAEVAKKAETGIFLYF